jgi:hypothetical protein
VEKASQVARAVRYFERFYLKPFLFHRDPSDQKKNPGWVCTPARSPQPPPRWLAVGVWLQCLGGVILEAAEDDEEQRVLLWLHIKTWQQPPRWQQFSSSLPCRLLPSRASPSSKPTLQRKKSWKRPPTSVEDRIMHQTLQIPQSTARFSSWVCKSWVWQREQLAYQAHAFIFARRLEGEEERHLQQSQYPQVSSGAWSETVPRGINRALTESRNWMQGIKDSGRSQTACYRLHLGPSLSVGFYLVLCGNRSMSGEVFTGWGGMSWTVGSRATSLDTVPTNCKLTAIFIPLLPAFLNPLEKQATRMPPAL